MSLVCQHVERLTAYTPGEQPQERDIVKLNTNENPYPPSPAVAAALAQFDPSFLRRYPDPMAVRLRQRIAAIHGCDLDQVFAGNGSDEVLALATRAFVEDNGGVGYFDPSYSLYPVLTDIRGATRHPVALGPGFSWQRPPAEGADLFLLTNPNAPTGVRHDTAAIAAFCRAFSGVVVIDEAYADFADETCMPLATAADNTNTLVMRTLSKSFSLAGLRLGYAVGPAPLITALYKVKDSYNLDMLTQVLGLAAMGDLDHMTANVRRVVATRGRLSAALAERGWSVLPSQTNFVFGRPPGGDAPGLCLRLRQARIYVRHFPGERTGEYVRITIGTDTEIDRLLAVLDGRA